jgi:hypothetical protein
VELWSAASTTFATGITGYPVAFSLGQRYIDAEVTVMQIRYETTMLR